jgi:hypothetical protein
VLCALSDVLHLQLGVSHGVCGHSLTCQTSQPQEVELQLEGILRSVQFVSERQWSSATHLCLRPARRRWREWCLPPQQGEACGSAWTPRRPCVQHVTSLRLRAAAQLLLAWSPLMQTEDPLRVALKLTRERGTGGTSCWWLGSMSYCTLRAWLRCAQHKLCRTLRAQAAAAQARVTATEQRSERSPPPPPPPPPPSQQRTASANGSSPGIKRPGCARSSALGSSVPDIPLARQQSARACAHPLIQSGGGAAGGTRAVTTAAGTTRGGGPRRVRAPRRRRRTRRTRRRRCAPSLLGFGFWHVGLGWCATCAHRDRGIGWVSSGQEEEEKGAQREAAEQGQGGQGRLGRTCAALQGESWPLVNVCGHRQASCRALHVKRRIEQPKQHTVSCWLLNWVSPTGSARVRAAVHGGW